MKASWLLSLCLLPAAATCLGAPAGALMGWGVATPGKTPEVFAPGVICLPERKEGTPTFSPDGREMYFTVVESNGGLAIFESLRTKEGWATPVRSAFSDAGWNWEPFLSPSGAELFFVSNRSPGGPKWNGRIWKMQRTSEGWTSPQEMTLPFTPRKGAWFPSVDRSGGIYLGAYSEAGENFGKGDLYAGRLEAGTLKIENLGSVINSAHEEWDPFIAPDGSYVLFVSDRPGGVGGVDIYVSFKRDDAWMAPMNLGPEINSAGNEVAARVSPDGKFLFFDRAADGGQDIFWVSSGVIEALRQKAFASRTGN
ncbi:MAG: hypothetical protein QM760_08060 [Nibricoccus sp.]